MEKGAFPCDTLKYNNTKTPEVHTAVVVGVLENLRSLEMREGEREGGRRSWKRKGRCRERG